MNGKKLHKKVDSPSMQLLGFMGNGVLGFANALFLF